MSISPFCSQIRLTSSEVKPAYSAKLLGEVMEYSSNMLSAECSPSL